MTETTTVTLVSYDGEKIEVTPGVIDLNATSAYLEGHCSALALALHRRTGWEVGVVIDEYGTEHHAFCVTDDGEAIDIEGHRELSHFIFDWDDRLGLGMPIETRTADTAELEAWARGAEPHIRCADAFAGVLLEGYEQDRLIAAG